MNDELTSVRKNKGSELLISEDGDSFEVLLASDHDFDLFKHMHFLPEQ